VFFQKGFASFLLTTADNFSFRYIYPIDITIQCSMVRRLLWYLICYDKLNAGE